MSKTKLGGLRAKIPDFDSGDVGSIPAQASLFSISCDLVKLV